MIHHISSSYSALPLAVHAKRMQLKKTCPRLPPLVAIAARCSALLVSTPATILHRWQSGRYLAEPWRDLVEFGSCGHESKKPACAGLYGRAEASIVPATLLLSDCSIYPVPTLCIKKRHCANFLHDRWFVVRKISMCRVHYPDKMAHMETHTTPLTNSQRVRRAKDKAIAQGGRRAPDGILSKDVTEALDDLVRGKYADTAIGAVSRALLDAQKRLKKD